MGDGAHFTFRAMISGIGPNRGLPQRDPTYSPSNEKSGNECGNFYAAKSRGLYLGKEKTHQVIDLLGLILVAGVGFEPTTFRL